MGKIKSILPAFMLISILAVHLYAFAQDLIPREKKIKAAYIFNFAKLIEWPETTFNSPEAPICLGIIGNDPLKGALMNIENKIAAGRAILIKKYEKPAEISKCHILFIGKSEKNNIQSILKQFHKRPVLTVSDIDGFASRGGMINFILINNRVRFEINLQTTLNSDLNVSSRLLKIANIVVANSKGKKR